MTRSTGMGAVPGGAATTHDGNRRRRVRTPSEAGRTRSGLTAVTGDAPVPGPSASEWHPSDHVLDPDERTSDGHPRIVVVDADPQIPRMVAAVLGPTGAAVVGVSRRAADAVELVEQLRPDLLLLEAGTTDPVPDGSARDGLEVAAELHRRRLVPVVLLLDDRPTTDHDHLGDSGAVGCVRKPLRSDALPAAIAMATARAAGLASLREQVADITGRLRDRELLERAKGLLMEHRGLSEPQAFRWLQRTAMDRRTPMTTVAAAVIDRFATVPRPVADESGRRGRRPEVPAPVLPPGHRHQDPHLRRAAVGQ